MAEPLTREAGSAAIVANLQKPGAARAYNTATRDSGAGNMLTAQNYSGGGYSGGGMSGGYSPVNLFGTQLGLQYTDLGSQLGGAMNSMAGMNLANQQAGNDMAMQQQKFALLQQLIGGGGGGAFGALGGGAGGISYGDTQSRQSVGGNFGGGQAQGGAGGGNQAGYYNAQNQWQSGPAAGGGGSAGGAAGGGAAAQRGGGQARRGGEAKWQSATGGPSGFQAIDPNLSKMQNATKVRQTAHGY